MRKPSRNASAPRSKKAKAATKREPESIAVEDGPDERFVLYRLCPCSACGGHGWYTVPEGKPVVRRGKRCPECRGEGKALERVATCADPQSVGVALVELAREGEFEDCPFGLRDAEGEKGKRWLILPWGPSPRNVSDAAKVLARSRKGEK